VATKPNFGLQSITCISVDQSTSRLTNVRCLCEYSYREDPLDAMRLILTNESNLIVQGNALDLVRKLLNPIPTERLGFAGGFSADKIGAALDQIVSHEWFSDLDVAAIMAGEGETPKIPPKIPLNELLGQKVDELPWSMGSTFLSKERLSAEQQETFADW
jgi:hypothetical protein